MSREWLVRQKDIKLLIHQTLNEVMDDENRLDSWAERAAGLVNNIILDALNRGDVDCIERVILDLHPFDQALVGKLLTALSITPDSAIFKYKGLRLEQMVAKYVVENIYDGDVTLAISDSDAAMQKSIIKTFTTA